MCLITLDLRAGQQITVQRTYTVLEMARAAYSNHWLKGGEVGSTKGGEE